MKRYILLYGDKKPEDNICIKNMFQNNRQIYLGWTEFDDNNNKKIIDQEIKRGAEQVIFSGFEIGWNRLVKYIKEKYSKIQIKVICNTQDSLLYYDYERDNFFELLKLSKENLIQDIAFLRKGQYETYKNLGYKCSYLRENYILKNKDIKNSKLDSKQMQLGIYPLNYTWDKNIFNQLCIAKFIEGCNLNYNNLDERMEDFLNTMNIPCTPDKIKNINDKELIGSIIKNDVIVSTSFTEYMHPVFFISMELGIPCLIGNNSDFFEESKELEKYIVTTAEDNAIINSEKVKNIIKEKDKIKELYKTWKKVYNEKAEKSIEEFISK